MVSAPPITTPSAFPGDPYGWITNQAGHVLFIGIGLFALAAITPLSRRQALGVSLALYGFWEITTYAGDALDGLTDLAFVAAGAVFGKAAWEGDRRVMAAAFVATLIAGAVGVWGRL